MDNELKPCPFCGGRVRLIRDLDNVANGIYCHSCESITRFNITMGRRETFGNFEQKWADKWNTRETVDGR